MKPPGDAPFTVHTVFLQRKKAYASCRFPGLFVSFPFWPGQRVPQVKLVDRTFNCHPARALALVEWLQDLPDDCPTNFHFEIEAGTLSES